MAEKKGNLKNALTSIEKQFWKGAIMRMGDNSNIGQVNTFTSGSHVLDLILGGGYECVPLSMLNMPLIHIMLRN